MWWHVLTVYLYTICVYMWCSYNAFQFFSLILSSCTLDLTDSFPQFVECRSVSYCILYYAKHSHTMHNRVQVCIIKLFLSDIVVRVSHVSLVNRHSMTHLSFCFIHASLLCLLISLMLTSLVIYHSFIPDLKLFFFLNFFFCRHFWFVSVHNSTVCQIFVHVSFIFSFL